MNVCSHFNRVFINIYHKICFLIIFDILCFISQIVSILLQKHPIIK